MIKINMGCGQRNFGPGWVHIDGGDYPHLDSNDILHLPYNNGTVDLIYTSHVIEYFDKNIVLDVLQEWRRVLKPGGILRVAVPDFEAMARLYSDGKISLNKILGPLYGEMLMGKQFIYHKRVYDYTTLKAMLEQLGMKDIKRYDWRKMDHAEFDDHSQAYLPHMDKENGTLISLNVEAIK